MRYQETWINGPTKEEHQRPCAERYEVIRELAAKYTRPFSVFDFGCNSGYFGFRLAQEFDCTVVMVDNKQWMEGLIEQNKPGKIVWIDAHPTAESLYHLSLSESFDIVLALSVLHHMDEHFMAFAALEFLADHIFIEVPGRGDKKSRNYESHCVPMLDFIEEYEDLTLIAEFDSHVSNVKRPMYYHRNTPFLKKQRVDADLSGASMSGNYDIEADYNDKVITITRKLNKPDGQLVRTTERRAFIPGINLHNFRLLGGGWPKAGTVFDVLGDVGRIDDKEPWNYILDGKNLHAIDVATKNNCTFPRVDIKYYANKDCPYKDLRQRKTA